MAQDETYNTIVYHQQGGERLVVGSGGTLAIESAGSVQVADSGTLTLQAGATLSIVTGASIGIAGTGFSPEELTRLIVSEQLQGSNLFSAGVETLAVSNLPKNQNVYVIYGSEDASANDASFWLTSVSAGREIWLCLFGDSAGTLTNASTTVVVSTSGCIILGSTGAHVSKFAMNTSLASDVMVRLIAPADNVWAIVSTRGDLNESNNL